MLVMERNVWGLEDRGHSLGYFEYKKPLEQAMKIWAGHGCSGLEPEDKSGLQRRSWTSEHVGGN